MYPEMERMFDTVMKKAMPYLILSPNNFRDDIASLMKSLYHSFREHNEVYFNELYLKVNEMIDNRESFDSYTENYIADFDGRRASFDERIIKLGRDFIDLKRKVENIEKSLSEIRKLKVLPKNDILENHTNEGKENKLHQKSSTELNTSEGDSNRENLSAIKKIPKELRPECCNKKLNKYKIYINGRQTYRCSGCNRIYMPDENGIIPTCNKCGHPIPTRRGKVLGMCPECAGEESSLLQIEKGRI